jgi:hypothetical protein
MIKISKKIEFFHFPLWILKDAAWFFGFGKLSLLLAIPATLLAMFLVFIKEQVEKLEWALISMWLISNVLWMSSELITKELHEYAKMSWQISLAFLPLYFFAIKKFFTNEREKI